MASEQDDARARQLEALRRYVAELGVQRERPAVETAQPQPASDHQRRSSPPWLLLIGLLVVVALVGGVVVGAVAWPNDRPVRGTGSAAVSSATQHPDTTAGAVASAGCKTAVDRANLMLASAVRLQAAMAEPGRILRDPANRRLAGSKVLQTVAPWLRASSGESACPGRLPAGGGPVRIASPLNQASRSGLHGGEHDHIGPVMSGGVVELPAAGDQPQRRGQGGVVDLVGWKPPLGVLLGPLDHEPDR
jgi:hypothetical protein